MGGNQRWLIMRKMNLDSRFQILFWYITELALEFRNFWMSFHFLFPVTFLLSTLFNYYIIEITIKIWNYWKSNLPEFKIGDLSFGFYFYNHSLNNLIFQSFLTTRCDHIIVFWKIMKISKCTILFIEILTKIHLKYKVFFLCKDEYIHSKF